MENRIILTEKELISITNRPFDLKRNQPLLRKLKELGMHLVGDMWLNLDPEYDYGRYFRPGTGTVEFTWRKIDEI